MTAFRTGHSYIKMALVISASAMFVIVIFFNAVNNSLGRSWGLYNSSIGAISNKYNLEITPSSATFSVWGIIYFWQTAWLLYSLTLICRQYSGGYLYCDPPVIPLPVYVVYCFNCITNIAWIFTWDREILAGACVFLYLCPLSLWLILFIALRAFPQAASALVSGGNTIDIWLVRLFLHNGIAIYAGWTTVASNLNLGICFVYLAGLSKATGSSIALGFLTAEILLIFTCEILVFEKHFRYIFAHYITLLAATVGSYVKNSQTASTMNSTWILVLMCMVITFIIVKIIRSIYMHVKHPLYKGSVASSAASLPKKEQLPA